MEWCTTVVKRSVLVAGHKTSISLENEFWQGLRAIAEERQLTVGKLIGQIDQSRHRGNLSSAVCVFVCSFYRESRLPSVCGD
jgi:predicted DNA-binding ribbon-helix-helix protein